jgi:uncharacterized protein
MNATRYIQQILDIPEKNIVPTLQLLAEDCTIPFIARYRKDKTGNLDETQIEQISKISKQFEEMVKRKETILKSIEEQNALTSELKQRIEESFNLQELEDLYLPFKKRKKNQSRCGKRKRTGTFSQNHYEPESPGSAVSGFKIPQ